MASPAEFWPQADLENHEELLAITDVDNFRTLFGIYMLLCEGEELPSDSLLYGYQEYLKTDPNGQATAEALNQLRANPQTSGLFERGLRAYVLEQDNKDVFIELIGRTAAHLPPGLGVDILHDPHTAEEAA
jgi:hypothetical protein